MRAVRSSRGSISDLGENLMPLAQPTSPREQGRERRVHTEAPVEKSQPPRKARQRLCDSCQETPSTFYCLQCKGWLCNRCESLIHTNHLFAKHNRIPATEYVQPVLCRVHPDEPVTHLCATCQEMCCVDCLVGNIHPPGPDHVLQSVANGVGIVRTEISNALDALRQRSAELEEALDTLSGTSQDLEESVDVVRARTRECFERLRQVLNEREAELLENVERFKLEQTRDLHEKTQIIRAAHTGMRSLIQECTQKLQQSTGLGILMDADNTSGAASSPEYKLALYKAASVIAFYLDRREELNRGKVYDTSSARSTAELLSAEAAVPQRYRLDPEVIRRYLDGIKSLDTVLAEFGFQAE